MSALRIIEREEKFDLECLQRQKSTGFLPRGRPKRWREKGLAVLRINVQERIEGNQLDSREDNKMWLVRHLELIRMITMEDLRIAKSLCQPVFPPSYNILDHFIHLYHEALSNRVGETLKVFSARLFLQKDLCLFAATGDHLKWSGRSGVRNCPILDHPDISRKGTHGRFIFGNSD